MTSENILYRNQVEASLVRKAWRDDGFRQRLLRNPQDVFKEELQGFEIGEARFEVVEETLDTFYLVLPMRPAGVRSDQDLAAMVKKGTYRLQTGLGLVAENREPVDLNLATIGQLADALSGIDAVFADAILSSRPFRTLGDLRLTFSTTTSRLLERIKDQFVVSTPAPAPTPIPTQPAPMRPEAGSSAIDVNTASYEELKELTGLARAIAEGITYSRPYYSVDQLPQRAPLIGFKAYDMLRSDLTL